MRPFTLLYFTSVAFVYSYSEEYYHHSLKKRSASPDLVIKGQQIDPITALFGSIVLGGIALAANHVAGDPAGKAVENLLGKENNNRGPDIRPPSNVEHHHNHYIPEYETEEGATGGCTCSDFVNKNGYGRCTKKGWAFPDSYFCYVNQPSSCKDLVNSGSNPEKQASAEACIDYDGQKTIVLIKDKEGDIGASINKKTLAITHIVGGGPADGKLRIGDRILAINGVSIEGNFEEVPRYIPLSGDSVSLVVLPTAYWYDWSPWKNSVCSKSCATGTMNQRRTRKCSKGPNACSGHAEEAKEASCNSHECPADGVWLAYSEWQDNGVCSKSCGGGTRLLVRHRQCQGPYGGGLACAGSSEDAKSIQCNPQACPIDGIWGAWNVLSTRQSGRTTCGADTVFQARERKCIGPYNGGKSCVGESYTERCVEDKSYRTEGHYTANPGVPTVHSNPRPSYGIGNGAINPREFGEGRALDDEIAPGEVEKPVHNTSRKPSDNAKFSKIKSSSNATSPLSLYDAILTPTANGNLIQAIKKPVYGAANSY